MRGKLLVIVLVLFQYSLARRLTEETEVLESWTGRWMPDLVEDTTAPAMRAMEMDSRVPMGVANKNCDDAKTNITIDWDGSAEDFTCMNPRQRIVPNLEVPPLIEVENIPQAYLPPHYCMDTEIIYKSPVPTFGGHRPLWPKYGEYEYVPVQRWLHNLEHGAVVALYHPCVDLVELDIFRNVVKNCLRRHIITPYKHLDSKRPFMLVAWGIRMSMAAVDEQQMRSFIQKRALHGPEALAKEGQYDFGLIESATIVSDFEDTTICPQL